MQEDKPIQGLQKNVAKAAVIREMCQTKGFTVLQAEIEKEKKRVFNKVLDPSISDEDILKHRREAQVWGSLDKILKKIMLTGEFSARALDNLEAPSTKEG